MNSNRIEREMTITRSDFFRLLPLALKQFEFQVTNNEINFQYDNGKVTIKIEQIYERKIASLVLPVMDVSFNFYNTKSESIDSFMNMFFKVYQRGGG